MSDGQIVTAVDAEDYGVGLDVVSEGGKLVMYFGEPVDGIRMGPDDAIHLAKLLKKKAREIHRDETGDKTCENS